MLNVSLPKLRLLAQRHWDAYDPSQADATDPYLVGAVLKLRNGQSLDAVADYFVEAEIDCLGIDTGGGIRERAFDLATALRACV